jgi:hypothetical protein
LVHFARQVAERASILTVYVDADEIKRLGFPDVLIRLLLRITEQMPGPRRGFVKRFLRAKPTRLEEQAATLRNLLDMADASDVTQGDKESRERQSDIGVAKGPAKAAVVGRKGASSERVSTFKERKLDALERHLQDYKGVLQESFAASGKASGAVIVDDFYLFHTSIQPDIVDYLHRLLRGTDMYLKIGTVRHRTRLLRQDGQAIGVELSQDVEEINLDRTFEDVASTERFLQTMLDSMAQKVGIPSAGEFVSEDGLLALALASGGVPRDYLNILVDGIEAARDLSQVRVTPKSVYRGAGRNSYRTKLKNLREDADWDADGIERVFQDLATFCLKEEKKTAFLIDQGETIDHEPEHEVIQQLMDFKLIHVIEPDTSAASGRSGRFEAYTLDFALFMEPRLRGIQHVEFWRKDEGRRRAGVREAPAYPLARAQDVLATRTEASTEGVLDMIEAEVGSDELTEAEAAL